MKAFILAGGLGTRLRPLTETMPKPLILIYGQPFISYQIRIFASLGIKDIVISTGYLGEQIQSYLGNGAKFGVDISYSHESKPLGSGGALSQAIRPLNDNVFILNGDDIAPVDWYKFLKFVKGDKDTLVLHPAKGDGNVLISKKGKKITKYQNGLGSSWTHAGLSFFTKQTLQQIPRDIFSLEEDFIAKLANQNRLYYFPLTDITLSIGTLERIEHTQQNLKSYLAKYIDEKSI